MSSYTLVLNTNNDGSPQFPPISGPTDPKVILGRSLAMSLARVVLADSKQPIPPGLNSRHLVLMKSPPQVSKENFDQLAEGTHKGVEHAIQFSPQRIQTKWQSSLEDLIALIKKLKTDAQKEKIYKCIRDGMEGVFNRGECGSFLIMMLEKQFDPKNSLLLKKLTVVLTEALYQRYLESKALKGSLADKAVQAGLEVSELEALEILLKGENLSDESLSTSSDEDVGSDAGMPSTDSIEGKEKRAMDIYNYWLDTNRSELHFVKIVIDLLKEIISNKNATSQTRQWAEKFLEKANLTYEIYSVLPTLDKQDDLDERTIDIFVRAVINGVGVEIKNRKKMTAVGIALAKKGYMDLAIQCYLNALKVNPNDLENCKTLRNIGIAYLKKRQPVRAQGYFEKAIELNSKYCLAYLSLAGAFEDQGEDSKAIAVLKQAMGLFPNDKLSISRHLSQLLYDIWEENPAEYKKHFEDCVAILNDMVRMPLSPNEDKEDRQWAAELLATINNRSN